SHILPFGQSPPLTLSRDSFKSLNSKFFLHFYLQFTRPFHLVHPYFSVLYLALVFLFRLILWVDKVPVLLPCPLPGHRWSFRSRLRSLLPLRQKFLGCDIMSGSSPTGYMLLARSWTMRVR